MFRCGGNEERKTKEKGEKQMKRFKIVDGGHVNLPADIADRWGTRFVSLEDHGDHVVLRPAEDQARFPDGLADHMPEEDVSSPLRRRSSGAGF